MNKRQNLSTSLCSKVVYGSGTAQKNKQIMPIMLPPNCYRELTE